MPHVLTLPPRPAVPPPGRLSIRAVFAPPAFSGREPIAAQIRNYYTLLHTDYVALQRQAALARVQQALEPLTAGLISTCG